MRIYFICGMPRAGTTYLSSLLNEHSQITSTGESLFFGRMYLEPKEKSTYSMAEISAILSRLLKHKFDNLKKTNRKKLDKKLTEEFHKLGVKASPKLVFKALAKAFLSFDAKKNVFIEKTPHHIQHTDRILQFFPDTKFIVLRRNPYEWLLSYKFQGSQKNKAVRKIFRRIYHPISAALVWRKNYSSITEAVRKKKDAFLVIENEDLNDKNTTDKILSFLNIAPEEISIPSKNSSFETIKKPKLTPVDIFWMNFICKKQLKEAPYKYFKSNANPLSIFWSVFKILPALAYSIKYVGSSQNIVKYFFNYLKK